MHVANTDVPGFLPVRPFEGARQQFAMTDRVDSDSQNGSGDGSFCAEVTHGGSLEAILSYVAIATPLLGSAK